MIKYIENADIDINKIINLYESLGWINYVKRKNILKDMFDKSLYYLFAFDDEELVGLIRVVGDGLSIIFIQDLLVKESHQNMGIGSKLLERVLEKYGDVYQIHLFTDNIDKNIKFYEKFAFIDIDKINSKAFTYINKKEK